jgi:flagellar motility protein MotE (MotC chaperone)
MTKKTNVIEEKPFIQEEGVTEVNETPVTNEDVKESEIFEPVGFDREIQERSIFDAYNENLAELETAYARIEQLEKENKGLEEQLEKSKTNPRFVDHH